MDTLEVIISAIIYLRKKLNIRIRTQHTNMYVTNSAVITY